MKLKILNLLLILTSLIGLLEWGKDSHMFLFQAEAEIIGKLFTDPKSVLHPFVLMPLFGQIALLVTIFQKKPSTVLTIVGLSGLALLLLLMLLIGVMSVNYEMIFYTLPFIVVAVLTIRHLWLQKKGRKTK